MNSKLMCRSALFVVLALVLSQFTVGRTQALDRVLVLKSTYKTHVRPASVPAISGNFAFLPGGEDGVGILDISNPANSRLVGRFGTNYAAAIAISGNVAYLAASYSLQVYDISEPLTPRWMGACDLAASPQSVTVAGNYALVAVYPSAIRIVDITNPQNPILAGSISGNAIAVPVNLGYVSNSANVDVLDLRDPASPQRIGTYRDDAARFTKIALSGEHAYATTGDRIEIIDTTDPSAPKYVSRHQTGANISDLIISDGRAYVTTGARGDPATNPPPATLQIFDLSSPTNLTKIGTYTIGTNESANGVMVAGQRAYVICTAGGETVLHIVDISNLAAPRRVGVHGGSVRNVFLSGSTAYVAYGSAGLHILDVSDPSAPRTLAQHATESVAYDVAVAGEYAYLANGNSGLRIIKVSSPANPELIGTQQTSGSARTLLITNGVAYVGADTSILDVFDVTRPDRPHLVSSTLTAGKPWDLARVGDFLYLAAGDAGLQLLDVSNPLQPEPRAKVEGIAHGLSFDGTRVYLAGGPAGVSAFDITTPAAPRLMGKGGWWAQHAQAIAPMGDVAYVAEANWGCLRGSGCFFFGTTLRAIDITNPERRLTSVSTLQTSSETELEAPPMALATRGNTVFLANGNSGLQIFSSAPGSLRFERLERDAAGLTRLRLFGPPGVSGHLQRSSDLNEWRAWLPVTFGEIPLELSDSEDNRNSAGFYRVIVP